MGTSTVRVKPNNYEIGMYCFFAKHAALRMNSKGWLVRNQYNVSDWDNMSILGLVSMNYHYENPSKRLCLVHSAPHHHLVEN